MVEVVKALRILVIDEEPPVPVDSGKKIRTWNLLTPLAVRHHITYVCFADAATPAHETLERAGIRLVAVPPRRFETGPPLYAKLLANCFSREPFSVAKHARRRFQRAVDALLAAEPFDVIHCEWTPYAQYAQDRSRPPVILATHNIEADILRRRGEAQSSRAGKLFFALQASRMEGFERRVFSKAAYVTAVSTKDEERARSWGARHTSVVANGVATDQIRMAEIDVIGNGSPSSRELLFLGSLDWFPNVDAIRYFLAETFPLLRARDADVHLSIVGRRPDEDLRRLVSGVEGATLIGEVDDVRPYLQRAAAVVVPLRIGGGTRIKILEAMAAGKIVVSTSIGAEGLEVDDGVHLLLADTPESFTEATLRALTAGALPDMPRLARQRVEERYSWRLQASRLEAVWQECANSFPHA